MAARVGFRIAIPPVLTPFPSSVLWSLPMGPSMPRIAGMNFVQRACSTGARHRPTSGTVWQMYCHSAPRVGRVWESGGDGCQSLNSQDPSLDHRGEPFVSFLTQADKSTDISLPVAVAHWKGCGIEDLAGLQFGGRRADDPTFLRLWEVSHARSMAAEQVE